MTNRGIDIKHPKQRGEWAELIFMARAAEHGLCITKPWGEMAHYDFAIEHKGHFLRVQVKSTIFLRRGTYVCCVFNCNGPYRTQPDRLRRRLCDPQRRLVHHSSPRIRETIPYSSLTPSEDLEIRTLPRSLAPPPRQTIKVPPPSRTLIRLPSRTTMILRDCHPSMKTGVLLHR